VSREKKKEVATTRDYRVKAGSGLAGAWRISLGVGALGLAAAGYGYTQDATRFAFSYLFAFLAFLTMGLGGMFFVLIQYLTKAGWSVTVRRSAEFFMSGLWVFMILVIPIMLNMGRLFPWLEDASQQTHVEHVAGKLPPPDEVDVQREPSALQPIETELGKAREQALEKQAEAVEEKQLERKSGFLNRNFFLARLVAYVLLWAFIANRYFKWSTDQDKSKNVHITAAAQRFAPVAMILFGLTVGFAAFDWIMSLEPAWASTMFGVTIFGGCTVVSMAMLVLFTLMLRRGGHIGNEINVEHFHDMGKLLFGWLVFWAYVSFFQYFLCWYANIPEELAFFHRRWNDSGGSWKTITGALVIFHFAIPFWLLMSRNIKRRVQLLATGAALLFVMHIVEIYWLVMPNYPGTGTDPVWEYAFAPSWVDLACLLGVGGIYFGIVLRQVAGYPLIPTGDPRLVRALEFENA
jgi:hypothetical protein